jgi:phosphoribosylanthranilate isomerase
MVRSTASLLKRPGARFTGLGAVSPTLERRAETAQSVPVVYESFVGRFSSPPFLQTPYLDKSMEIMELADSLGVGGVQLHGPMAATEVASLRSQRPHFFLIKSLIVRRASVDDLAAEVAHFHPLVNAFITDTYDPTTGRSGATGQPHDWRVSRRLVDLAPKPVILAGGLTPENVHAGILRVHPAGVDVHTGVEGPEGRKVLTLVEHFVAEAGAAFRVLEQDMG